MKTIRVAESRIGDAIKSAVRDDISKNALKEAVLSEELTVSRELLEELEGSTSGDDGDDSDLVISVKVGREAITRNILLKASKQVEEFGIELIDVRLKRLNYNPDVRPEVYGRMISERERIATMFRSEGKKDSDIIRGQVQKSVDIISSKAKREAEEIRGAAQGQATKIYNEAYGVDPEFYAFFRSMEAYGDAVGSGSTLILKSDSDFFKYLREISDADPAQRCAGRRRRGGEDRKSRVAVEVPGAEHDMKRSPQLSLKEKLTLYMMVALAALGALMAWTVVPHFADIFKDVLGEDAELPHLTAFVVLTAKLWFLLPLGLLLLHAWSVLRKDKRHAHWVWYVVVFGCLVFILFVLLSGFSLFLPLTKITVGLAP